MDLEEIIKKISGESGIEEKEIRRRIEAKQKELGGLITAEGAAHIVANEVGINLFEGIAKKTELKIENIIPGMQSVDVVGRVLRIFSAREFTKSDGSKSKVCSLILGDETATIRVAFWGKDVALLEESKIKEGDILRIRGGYTKENMNGEAELHIGTRTRVIPNPKDVAPKDVLLPNEAKKKISELSDGMQSVDVVCKVLRIYEPREFEREDKTRGKVANLVVGDETGRAKLVLWNEDATMVEKVQIKEGDTVKVRKGYVKMRFNEPEINVGRYGKAILAPPEEEIKEVAEFETEELKRKRIKELKEGERAEIRGAIVDISGSIRAFDRKEGKGVVINAVIDDGSESMRAAFYDKMAELLLGVPLEKLIEGAAQDAIAQKRKTLLGKEVIATVKVRHSDFTGKNELVIQDANLNPDAREEVKLLLNEAKSVIG